MTSDVVTVATHCCCVPVFTTVIAMNVAFSVVDVVIAVVVFVGAAVAVVFTAVCKGPATRNDFVNDIVNVSSSTIEYRRYR